MDELTAVPPDIVLEPARGRRKARISCSVPGCERLVIQGRLSCLPCYRLAPNKLKVKNKQICRELKAATDDIEYSLLVATLVENCLAILNAIVQKKKELPS